MQELFRGLQASFCPLKEFAPLVALPKIDRALCPDHAESLVVAGVVAAIEQANKSLTREEFRICRLRPDLECPVVSGRQR